MCPATLRASLLESQVTDTPVIRLREPLEKLEMDLWRFAQYQTVSDTLHVSSALSCYFIVLFTSLSCFFIVIVYVYERAYVSCISHDARQDLSPSRCFTFDIGFVHIPTVTIRVGMGS